MHESLKSAQWVAAQVTAFERFSLVLQRNTGWVQTLGRLHRLAVAGPSSNSAF